MLGRLRILDRQLAEQCRGSLGSLTLLQMLPNLRVGAREGDVVDGRTGVQAGATDQNRPYATRLEIGDGFTRHLLEPRDRHRLARLNHVEQMMPDRRTFLVARLRGADIHAAVHLVGVGIHYLGTFTTIGESPGDRDAQASFPRGGGADDRDHTRAVMALNSCGWHRSVLWRDRGLQSGYDGQHG